MAFSPACKELNSPLLLQLPFPFGFWAKTFCWSSETPSPFSTTADRLTTGAGARGTSPARALGGSAFISSPKNLSGNVRLGSGHALRGFVCWFRTRVFHTRAAAVCWHAADARPALEGSGWERWAAGDSQGGTARGAENGFVTLMSGGSSGGEQREGWENQWG